MSKKGRLDERKKGKKEKGRDIDEEKSAEEKIWEKA